MSIPLTTFNPLVPYIGQPFFKPAQLAGIKGYCVPLSFNWLSYQVGLGQPNVGVGVDLDFIAAPKPLDKIRSIYIDNLGSQVPVIVTFPDTGFAVACQANATGWYPVFTNSMLLVVGALGFTNANIGQTNVFISNIPISPYTDPSQQNVNALELASPVIGGGSGLASIVILNPGLLFTGAGLLVSGGGGSAATAFGTLNSNGAFINTTITAAGNGFLGLPSITPTSSNPAAPVWTAFTGFNPGDKTSWLTGTYLCGVATGIHSNTPPPNDPAHWSFIGTNPPPNASFLAVLAAPQNAIQSSGYGIPALGDQAISVLDTITAGGVFRNNLWGTPFGSGFIYLTHIYISSLSANTCSWQLESSGGQTPFLVKSASGAGTTIVAPSPLLDIQKMNMKLDATQTWRLNCTSHGSDQNVLHAFAWTYSQY